MTPEQVKYPDEEDKSWQYRLYILTIFDNGQVLTEE